MEDELPPSPDTSDPIVNEEDHKNTGSPFSASPDLSNGRIVTLALPIQNQRSTPFTGASGGGGGGGREDCWSEDGTAVLIEAWGERYSEQNRGIVKQKQWDEVAEIVNSRISGAGKPGKTDVQCKNRMDTVKRKYKSEKAKISAGGGVSGWIFFDRLDRLLGNANPNSSSSAARISNQQTSSPPISLRNRAFLQRHTKRPIVDSDSDSPESSDSLPPVIDRNFHRTVKRQKIDFDSPPPSRPPRFDGGGRSTSGTGIQTKANDWRNSVIELTKVIFMFSEAYEQAESEKLQQMVEMEKHRMKFAKELELQRMKFLMKTQLQLSRLTNHHQEPRHSHANDESNANGNNNSDDCSN